MSIFFRSSEHDAWQNHNVTQPICVCFDHDIVMPDFRNHFCKYIVISDLLTSALTTLLSNLITLHSSLLLNIEGKSNVFIFFTCYLASGFKGHICDPRAVCFLP